MLNHTENNPSCPFPHPIKTLIFWGVVLFWILAFTATHLPSYPTGSTGPRLPIDKLVHFGIYASLATGMLFIVWTRAAVTLKTCLTVFLILTAYGMFDELTQSFIPGRYPDIYDWYADCLGIIAGTIFSLIAFKMISIIIPKTAEVKTQS